MTVQYDQLGFLFSRYTFMYKKVNHISIFKKAVFVSTISLKEEFKQKLEKNVCNEGDPEKSFLFSFFEFIFYVFYC